MQTLSSQSVEAAATNRVSIRKYSDEPISRAELEEIVALAGKAPSAWNIQPWRFIVVTNQEIKEKLQGAAYGQPQVGSSKALIVLTTDMKDALAKLDESLHPLLGDDKRAETSGQVLGIFGSMGDEAAEQWGRNQGNIALGYLLLVLESKGLGSSPMLGFDGDQVRSILGLPAHVQIPALVSVGHKADSGFPQHRSPLSTTARFVE